MKNIASTILLFLFFCQLASAEPLAIVTDLSGQSRAGNKSLELLDSLDLGLALTIPKGSSITLSHLSNGSRYRGQGPVTLEVTKRGIRVLAGDRNSLRKMGGRKNRLSKSVKPVSLSIGAEFHRSEDPWILLSQGKTMLTRPSLSWTAHPEAELYRVEVFQNSERLFASETEDFQTDWPLSVKPLKPGEEFTLRLSALVEDDDEEFQLIQSTEGQLNYEKNPKLEKKIQFARKTWKEEQKDPSPMVLAIAHCINNSQYGEALRLLKELDSNSSPELVKLNTRIHQKLETLQK